MNEQPRKIMKLLATTTFFQQLSPYFSHVFLLLHVDCVDTAVPQPLERPTFVGWTPRDFDGVQVRPKAWEVFNLAFEERFLDLFCKGNFEP